MPESLQGVLAEAKKGRFSAISNLSEGDIGSVWESVCNYIEKQMSQQKGVQISSFGTFSFSQRRLDIGNNKFILTQRPVFNISEKFAQTLGLQFTKYNVPGHVPAPPLNFAALSFETPFDRDTVDSCVKEIVNSISRAVAAKRNVELVFSGIGRLIIRDSRVKMRFYKEFINQMDGSGDMLNSMQNRPGTVDSVMSNHPLSRPPTSNTVVLPRILPNNSGNSSSPLAPVAEQDEVTPPSFPPADLQNTTLEEPGHQRVLVNFSIPEAAVLPHEMGEHAGAEDTLIDDFGDFPISSSLTQAAMENVLNDETVNVQPVEVSVPKGTTDDFIGEHKVATVPSRAPSRMAMPIAKATGVSLLDDLLPSSGSPRVSPGLPAATQASLSDVNMRGDTKFLKPPTPPRLVPLHRSHSVEDLTSNRLQQKMQTPPGSACGHPNAGQELCYLCHQRARRNIPVYFAEERKRREEEEERLLVQYQTMKDAEDLLREQERQISRRHDSQKASAFNLGVAEAVNAKRRAKDCNPQRSYIFQQRPLTPARFSKQEEYLKDLTKQVEGKEAVLAQRKADENFLERLEQVQLAEDLAAQREHYLKDREDQKNVYRQALDAQLRYKPVPLPPYEPDGEVFGKNDMNNEKMAERRRRAQQLSQEQQELVSQRKREALLRHLAEQEQDQMMLERSRRGLLEDHAYNYKMRLDSRRHLENNWTKAAEMKRARDLEDRLIGLETGMLLHEQCDQYNRCKQCKRRLANCGESNIWSESRYVPGCRIMV